MVTREPEWDDYNRGLAEADYLVRKTVCRCGCNQPVSRAHDPNPELGWVVHHGVCNAGAALAIAQRDAKQKRLPPEERMKGWQQGRPMPGDGEFWWVEPHDGTRPAPKHDPHVDDPPPRQRQGAQRLAD